MDESVVNFFTKNGDEYERLYRLDHGPRIRALLDRYDLVNRLKGKSVLDVGGGQGFLGEMLDKTTDYWVVDGANVPETKRLCRGTWYEADLDRHSFGEDDGDNGLNRKNAYPWDVAFCLEVLEHLISPYHCIDQIKSLVRRDGEIYLSVPTETVWHNTPYPSLFWPTQNFVQWLRQMALPVEDFYIYEPKERGWPAYQFKCRNADWKEARMLYPKDEAKFIGKKPHEYANL